MAETQSDGVVEVGDVILDHFGNGKLLELYPSHQFFHFPLW
jgi:hypothetical protein